MHTYTMIALDIFQTGVTSTRSRKWGRGVAENQSNKAAADISDQLLIPTSTPPHPQYMLILTSKILGITS